MNDDTLTLERPKATEKKISVEELDRLFDEGQEDVIQHFDLSTATRPNRDKNISRVNLDLPTWAIERLDQESGRIGISRQSLMKMWLVEKLDGLSYMKEKNQDSI